MARERPRVVVTGLGVISSVGSGHDRFWSELLEGSSGVSPVTSFPTDDYGSELGGEIKGFCAEDHLPRQRAARYGRASQLAICAASLALEDAGLRPGEAPATDVLVGTTMGESTVLEQLVEGFHQGGADGVDRELLPRMCDGRLPVSILRELALEGDALLIPTACAAGNYAIGAAYDRLRSGRTQCALAGGVDAFSHIAFIGFARMMSLAKDKIRPFDAQRSGIVVGEGAGFLLLETLERAKARGAKIYAELLGYGLSCDAHHMTTPNEDGVAAVMESALRHAGIAPDEVDFVSAHGTGTKANDRTECAAIARVFGSRSKRLPTVSIKSMLGHAMGAASALEAVACVRAITDGRLPPTINYETPDPECPIDCVPNRARRADVRVALNNSFAFGGNNAATVFARMS